MWMPLHNGVATYGLETVTATATSISWSNGKTGCNATLNAAADKIVCDDFAWQPTSSWTMAGWMKPTVAQTSLRGCLVRNSDTYGPFLHWPSTHVLTVGYYTSTTKYNVLTSTFIPEQNVFHHYCATWDGQKIKLYIDGVLDSSIDSADPIYYPATRGTLCIGRTDASGTFMGTIGDVRCYNYALSESEIYNLSLGKIGHYLLNGMGPMSNGDRVEYCGIYKHNGSASATLTNSARKIAGSPRYTHSFKANGNYIQLPSVPFAYAVDAFSISLWAYADDWMTAWGSAAGPAILSAVNSGGWGLGRLNGTVATDGVTINTYFYTNGAFKIAGVELSTITSGWHHFVGTCDGYIVKFYIDGVLAATNTADTTHYNISQLHYPQIGYESAGSNKRLANGQFKGQISDIEFFAKALTLEDVEKIYQKAHIPS